MPTPDRPDKRRRADDDQPLEVAVSSANSPALASTVLGCLTLPLAVLGVCLVPVQLFVLPLSLVGVGLGVAGLFLKRNAGLAVAGLASSGCAAAVSGGVLLFVGYALYKAGDPAPSRPRVVADATLPSDPGLYYTAGDLEAEFAANAVAAEDALKGRRVVVVGLVRAVDTDVLNKPYASLVAGPGDLLGVRCGLANREEAAGLTAGEAAAVVGTCKGRTLGMVLLEDCAAVDVAAVRAERSRLAELAKRPPPPPPAPAPPPTPPPPVKPVSAPQARPSPPPAPVVNKGPTPEEVAAARAAEARRRAEAEAAAEKARAEAERTRAEREKAAEEARRKAEAEQAAADEKAARQKLDLALAIFKASRKRGVERLEEILAKYPGTKAAKEAREALERR